MFSSFPSSSALSVSQTAGNRNELLALGSLLVGSLLYLNKEKKALSWIYRDDIGAPNGIHGYEEQVNSVGQHHGHYHWAREGFLSTFDSASVRRGFKVWLKNCQQCHSLYKQKYDIMIDKVFTQQELINRMEDTPPIHPGHQMKRSYYFLEWDYRNRLIHDRIWSAYMTRDRVYLTRRQICQRRFVAQGLISHGRTQPRARRLRLQHSDWLSLQSSPRPRGK